MNSNLIYLEEKITHALLVVHLYILRLPQKPSDYEELNEIIRKNKIKVIFNVGTSNLQNIQVEKLENLSEDYKIDETVNKIHQELIVEKSNIGLICSESCKNSLIIYFNYMVRIEEKEFEQFPLQQFSHIFSVEDLKSKYDDIKQKQNVLNLDYNLFNTVSIMPGNQSENNSVIIKIEQRKSNIINTPNKQTNQHRQYNGHQECPFQNGSRIRILALEDQVESIIDGFQVPPFRGLQDFLDDKTYTNNQIIQQTHNQQSLSQQNSTQNIPPIEQHSLKFENEYKLPQSITFINFMPQDGFKCLE